MLVGMERKPTRPRVVGRGEKVLPGIWRLRLPLPWPGVPHCNAWALAAGDGIVLVDTGMHQPGSLLHLEQALQQCGLGLEQVALVVCTHAHSDHCGQASPVAERAGCPIWMHPDRGHLERYTGDPEAQLARRLEVARQSGVPAEPLHRWAQERRAEEPGVAGPVRVERDLVDGVTISTDAGIWEVVETPGHAPSHVCLIQRERRLLISGDHVLGRPSLYFDFGYSPDPVGDFLRSLDRVAACDPRLGLAGHGRPFVDVPGHIAATRRLALEGVATVRARLDRAATAYEIARAAWGDGWQPATASWLLALTLCYLTHLEVAGEARRLDAAEPAEPDLWVS
jgi:glyoxylase-like metal-dependent hydrolase (beta-lactamase superfamily II)